MKKIYFLSFFLISTQLSVWAANQTTDNNPAYDQAKQDYKAYLQQLKVLGQQYQQVVGQIKTVLKEEGVPTVDENTGAITMQKFEDKPTVTTRALEDASIEESDKEINVKIDLPGVRKNTIKVVIQDNKFIKITGERESARQSGAFEKRIELPSDVQDKGTEAWYENGVLAVKVLKASEIKKEISVSVK